MLRGCLCAYAVMEDRMMRLWSAAAALALAAGQLMGQCGSPTGQPLGFTPSGDFGTIGLSESSWSFSPQGGTPPYTFSLASGAANIPGFRIATAPDAPN